MSFVIVLYKHIATFKVAGGVRPPGIIALNQLVDGGFIIGA